MPTFANRRHVKFTPTQMYDLVADVECYPQFVPLCEGLTVNTRQPTSDGEMLVATMAVGYKTIREKFTTRVTLRPDKEEILVEYLDGPFSHLENRWRFLPTDSGCDVDFYIDYRFRSSVLAMVMGGVFEKAFRKFATAFEDRALEVYGPHRPRHAAEDSPSTV
ncbi:MAG: type II toxin-antitoxin system RatA family toxin [Alphaproteobacteria bacterium]|nr:type II toxin-antitoxin system RatA family toxin [Alphaproteobacteria bacterium]